jgi:repressor LexA
MARRAKVPRRQQEVLEHIVRFMQTRGYPPSTRDLCSLMGVTSSSTIHTHLQGLIARGLINKPYYKSRSITLPTKLSQVAQKKELVNVPLIGTVRPGTDPLAMENLDDQFPLPAQFVGGNQAVLTRAGDAGMASEGIFQEDLVIVQPRKTLRSGELVAAIVKGEPVIRRYHKDRKRAWLEAADPTLPLLNAKDVTLLGKVVGVIRLLK